MPDVGRPADEAEIAAYFGISSVSFLGTPDPVRIADHAAKAVHDNFRLVRRGRTVVGGLHIIRMGQWFGGASVPMAGIAGVAVDPQHRAGGAGSELIRSTLQDLHADGFALSVLYPATQPVY